MNNNIKYVINDNTLAIVPIDKRKSKVYEKDNVIIVDRPTKKIIEENCIYYGSTYEGRRRGTYELIGITHKSPILISNQSNMVFFPTCSPRIKECGWISLSNVEDYSSYEHDSIIRFSNNLKLQIPVSSKIINNQVLKSTRLESVVRKNNLKKKRG